MFKHVIFDCDGVLVDSEPLSMEVDRDILAENGIAMTVEEVGAQFIGLTFEAFIEKIEGDFRIKLPKDVTADKNRRLLALYERKLRPRPAFDATLARLQAANERRLQQPASSRRGGLPHCRACKFFDDRITTYEDVARASPRPDIYIEAAGVPRVSPEACLVIEDSKAGVTSAVAAGCHVIGFTGLAHEGAALRPEAMAQLGAQKVVDRHADLPAAIAAALRL